MHTVLGNCAVPITSLWAELEKQLILVFSHYRSRISELPVQRKADRTLLTEADVEVQRLIVDEIRCRDPQSTIIAEEDARTGTREEVLSGDGRVWVIDPIDGTAQFIRPDSSEFCSVVCLLEDWRPAEAFVLAPELGTGRMPLSVTADAPAGAITVNRGRDTVPPPGAATKRISATRSRDEAGRPFDEEDAFGEWARAAAVTLAGPLEGIAVPGRGSIRWRLSPARDPDWIAFVVDRVQDYRDRSEPLRRAVEL